MPLIQIDMFPGRTLEQKREMTEVLTREVCRIAKCTPQDVNIIFRDVAKEDWGLAGTLAVDE